MVKKPRRKKCRSNIASDLIPLPSFFPFCFPVHAMGVLRSDTSCNCKQMWFPGCDTNENFPSHWTSVQSFCSLAPRWGDREELLCSLGAPSRLCNACHSFVLGVFCWEERKQGCCNQGFASGVGSPLRSSVYHFQPGASWSLQDPEWGWLYPGSAPDLFNVRYNVSYEPHVSLSH